MNALKEYIHNDFYALNKEYWDAHDFNVWLDESYDDVADTITEDEFYYNKYSYDSYLHDRPMYVIWKKYIYERLKESIQITNDDIEKIKFINGIEDIRIENTKRLCFTIKYNGNFDRSAFVSLMNFYGYTINSINDNTLTLEAYHPKEINYKDDYVYHVTNKSCYERIKEYGLLPHRKEKYKDYYELTNKTILEYPERIYCWSQNTNKETIKSFISLSRQLEPANNHKDLSPVILKIDIAGLNKYREKNNKISFYADSAYNVDSAMFTMEPIPSKYIKEISLDEIQIAK